jgi:hypothetical protein
MKNRHRVEAARDRMDRAALFLLLAAAGLVLALLGLALNLHHLMP